MDALWAHTQTPGLPESRVPMDPAGIRSAATGSIAMVQAAVVHIVVVFVLVFVAERDSRNGHDAKPVRMRLF
jgi:hypothetical protein